MSHGGRELISGGLPADAPGGPLFCRSRVEHRIAISDQLDTIEAVFLDLAGRLGRRKIGIAGHSMGVQTAAVLLGARLTDPRDSESQDVNVIDERSKAGVLLTILGRGGDSLSDLAAQNATFFNPTSHTWRLETSSSEAKTPRRTSR